MIIIPVAIRKMSLLLEKKKDVLEFVTSIVNYVDVF